ncbi:hypothetical protein RSSM_02824 [Rhodopirellula sallentina SM41]|uniref:Uncharacterized protein n=1 Tax=Rhodopirellula sallentina SM41 TaxID=1263870 RepID=M5U2Q4_9BACT|nr:hypothetical protein RSSM_02824 [Rhodopirellula sallentina SM41]
MVVDADIRSSNSANENVVHFFTAKNETVPEKTGFFGELASSVSVF